MAKVQLQQFDVWSSLLIVELSLFGVSGKGAPSSFNPALAALSERSCFLLFSSPDWFDKHKTVLIVSRKKGEPRQTKPNGVDDVTSNARWSAEFPFWKADPYFPTSQFLCQGCTSQHKTYKALTRPFSKLIKYPGHLAAVLSTMSTFNPLSGIKGTPVGFSCSRKASMVFDLAVRAVGSAPTGQRALLLAITYRGTLWARTPHALVQPKYDAELMKSYLLETGKWAESDITVLTDAEGTPENRLPTHANIMREIEALGKSNCQNVFFLYTGHAGQRLQPKQSTQSRVVPKGAPGRRLVEEYDQYIIPIDAVTGPELEDINQDLVILDDVLHECLISTLHARSTFLAILDTCHSATLFDLEHHRCNRTRSLKSFLRRSFRKVVVEPLWEILGKATDGGLANADSFNISDSCNGLCPRRKNLICPIAVTISACKDRQHIYENGPSLTETIVRLLRSKPTAGLPDVIDAVLINYKRQQKHMKNLEKQYKKAGNTVMMQKMREMRLQAGQLMPEVASTAALDLSRSHSWSGLAMRN